MRFGPEGSSHLKPSPVKVARWERHLWLVRDKLYEAHRLARYAHERDAIRHALYQVHRIQFTSIDDGGLLTWRESSNPTSERLPRSSVHRMTLLLYLEKCSQAMQLLQQIRSHYPTLHIRIAVGSPRGENCTSEPYTDWMWGWEDTSITWIRLASSVKTELVMVGRNMVEFSLDSNLKRLLYAYDTLRADILGGAVRLEPEGQWFAGCYKNYTRWDFCSPNPDQSCMHHWLRGSSVHAYLVGYQNGIPKTNGFSRINLYGVWLFTYRNPGAKVRNVYRDDLLTMSHYSASNPLYVPWILKLAQKYQTIQQINLTQAVSRELDKTTTDQDIFLQQILPQGNIQFKELYKS
ncbi:unnamed protein product [Echinostoma caproni]|uniref:Glycosyl transferase n=1 Tax=Echinostoma caproni TaxID=27848 RepID=A0A183AV29_9TREM|nr:unnamed protein product [Echinostoma caproni]